jgi:hypothetical protein
MVSLTPGSPRAGKPKTEKQRLSPAKPPDPGEAPRLTPAKPPRLSPAKPPRTKADPGEAPLSSMAALYCTIIYLILKK